MKMFKLFSITLLSLLKWFSYATILFESSNETYYTDFETSFTPALTPSPMSISSPSNEPTNHVTSQPPTAQPTIILTAQPIVPTNVPTNVPVPTNAPTDGPTNPPTEFGERPNLIMILTDEHNIRTLGCYRDYFRSQNQDDQATVWGRNLEVETPNIDRLAREGALMTNFYTVAPLCTPSRASFLSGLYPAATGGSNVNHGRMDDDIVTFAEILKEKRDYHTGYIGKFHLNGEDKPGWGNETRKFGFIENKYLYNQGHWKWLDEVDGNMEAYTYLEGGKFKKKQRKHFTTVFLFDRGIEFMERAKSLNKPFSYVLSIPDPHAPNQVRRPYDEMFNDMHFKLPLTGRQSILKDPAPPKWNFHDHMEAPLDDAEQYIDELESRKSFQNHLQQYFGMVKCIDDNVGKLLNYLTEAGIDEETIIV